MRRVRNKPTGNSYLIQGKLKAVTCDTDDNGAHAKLACVEPSTDLHANAPGLHTGIKLSSVFCSETHWQSGEGKKNPACVQKPPDQQPVASPSFIFGKWLRKTVKEEVWHGASHDLADDPMGLHFSSDSENKVEKVREAGAACVSWAKRVSFLECNAHQYGRESRVLKNQTELINTFLLSVKAIDQSFFPPHPF